MTKAAANEYVEGFDLRDYTLDIGLAEALEYLDKTCKKKISNASPIWTQNGNQPSIYTENADFLPVSGRITRVRISLPMVGMN